MWMTIDFESRQLVIQKYGHDKFSQQDEISTECAK